MMADDRMIELQRGLEYYYEAQKEFERRGLDIEQQVAFGFETGYQIGRAEALSEESLKLIRQPMREWA
jgi:hypothetical protein